MNYDVKSGMKTKRFNYDSIVGLYFECTCAEATNESWDKLMTGAVRADKRKVNALVKKFLPDTFRSLSLNLYNPYEYERTKTHFILVHSAIEYFIRFHMRCE